VPSVTIHDFRVTDAVLAQTDPDAGDIVYLGPSGGAAFPFVIWRRLSAPGGVYMDACEIVDGSGATVEFLERKYELEGESLIQDVVDELRETVFPSAGEYKLRYYVYDDHVVDIPFQVAQSDPPHGAVVPGPVDAALAKSTIAWIVVPQDDGTDSTKAVWYGYEEGRVYVLTGPGEQDIPGLAGPSKHVRLIARSKDIQSKVGEVTCVTQVLGKDAAWEKIARDVMLGRRLNLPDGEAAVDRWKKECEIVVLTPFLDPLAT
jgi:hypothetical protein